MGAIVSFNRSSAWKSHFSPQIHFLCIVARKHFERDWPSTAEGVVWCSLPNWFPISTDCFSSPEISPRSDLKFSHLTPPPQKASQWGWWQSTQRSCREVSLQRQRGSSRANLKWTCIPIGKRTIFAFQYCTFAYRLIQFPFRISFDVIFPYLCLFQSPCLPWLHSRSCLDSRVASCPRVTRWPALICTRVVPWTTRLGSIIPAIDAHNSDILLFRSI
jgi:hypothetical protein